MSYSSVLESASRFVVFSGAIPSTLAVSAGLFWVYAGVCLKQSKTAAILSHEAGRRAREARAAESSERVQTSPPHSSHSEGRHATPPKAQDAQQALTELAAHKRSAQLGLEESTMGAYASNLAAHGATVMALASYTSASAYISANDFFSYKISQEAMARHFRSKPFPMFAKRALATLFVTGALSVLVTGRVVLFHPAPPDMPLLAEELKEAADKRKRIQHPFA